MAKVKAEVVTQLLKLKSASAVSICIKASVVIATTLIFFYNDLSLILANALNDETSLYVLAVPVLFGYLLYRKRKMVRAVISANSTSKFKKPLTTIVGLLLLAIAIVLYWYGSYTFTPLEYHMVTIPLFVAGLVLFLFNYETLRQLAFPIAFLIFLQPPPSQLLYGLGSTLSVISSEASNAFANLLGVSSQLSGEFGNPAIIITRPDGSTINFIVDLACSGIFSLIGFTLFAVFIAYATRGKLLRKIAVFLMGLPLIFLLNIIRLTTILTIGYHYGEALALQVFHIIGASVLMFIGTLFVLILRDRLFKNPPASPPCPKCNPKQPKETTTFCLSCGKLLKYPSVRLNKTDLAKIAALAITIGLFLSIQAPVFALTQGPAQVIIQTPTGERGNTEIFPQIQDYNLSYSYRDTDFEKRAKQDASLVYSYRPIDTSNKLVTVAVEIAESKSSLHPWETCLITWPQTHGYQPKITQLDLKDAQIHENPPIIARFFTFRYESTNDIQMVLYWFETATFIINNASVQKQVKISLITFPDTSQDFEQAENQLILIATAIARHWEPIKTWTQIAFAISQNGGLLALILTGLITLTIFYQAFLLRREKQAILILYDKLASKEKLLLQAVTDASKTGKPTAARIAESLKKLTGNSIKMPLLGEKLGEAERSGLIQKTIANRNDEPLIIWKNQVQPSFYSRLTRILRTSECTTTE
jgi:exosortase/archaeosortase family protein